MMLKELDAEARVTRSAAVDPEWDAPPAAPTWKATGEEHLDFNELRSTAKTVDSI
jgi:hypothetical protein